jgi:polyisoprenyl-phosphate glycosyltransferase
LINTNKVSVVIPVYNEEGCVSELLNRLNSVLNDQEIKSEIILVDDGSRDNTLTTLQKFARKNETIKLIVFSRNFGNQAAISAGLQHCNGDCAIIMDADLQDPPELLPDMIAKWKEGFDVVYAQRVARKGESFFKKITASVFYRLLQKLTPVDIPSDTGDFRLIDRKVIIALNSMPENNRYLRGMVSWSGFRQTGITYVRDKRMTGETKFPFFKMIRFALTGITSFSFVPLQLASFLGFIVSAGAFISGIYVLYLKLFTDKTIQGWTSLMIALLFLGGIQLITLGIIGEYIGRISEEVKQRPPYLISDMINFHISDENVIPSEAKESRL